MLKLLEFLNSLIALIKAMRPTAFEKKESAKKDANDDGQKFWDDRNI